MCYKFSKRWSISIHTWHAWSYSFAWVILNPIIAYVIKLDWVHHLDHNSVYVMKLPSMGHVEHTHGMGDPVGLRQSFPCKVGMVSSFWTPKLNAWPIWIAWMIWNPNLLCVTELALQDFFVDLFCIQLCSCVITLACGDHSNRIRHGRPRLFWLNSNLVCVKTLACIDDFQSEPHVRDKVSLRASFSIRTWPSLFAWVIRTWPMWPILP